MDKVGTSKLIMDKLSNPQDAKRFLGRLGLHISETVVQQVVNIVSGKADQSLYSLYATRPHRPPPACGKGTAYKIKRLYDKGELEPYLAYLSPGPTVGEAEVEQVKEARREAGKTKAPLQMWMGHQERLIELVESWKKELATPVWQFTLIRLGTEVPRSEDGFMWEGTAEGICRKLLVSKAIDKENSLLWECLCQHLQAGGYSWLLEKLGDWEKVGGQELLGRAALRQKIENMVTEKLAWERWKTVRDAHGTWTPFFASTTEGILIDGVPPDHPPVGEPEAGIYRSYCGKSPIASATKAEGACAFQRYQIVELKLALESDPSTERVRILKTKRNSVTLAIEDGLAEILVRGYIPGKCRFCPPTETSEIRPPV